MSTKLRSLTLNRSSKFSFLLLLLFLVISLSCKAALFEETPEIDSNATITILQQTIDAKPPIETSIPP